MTYFILNQLDVIGQALDELLAHLKQRAARAKDLARAVAGFDELNYRQRALLQKAIRHPLQSYTIVGHRNAHRVHYLTARKDLEGLVNRGFFEVKRIGKAKRFYPSAKLVEDGGD